MRSFLKIAVSALIIGFLLYRTDLASLTARLGRFDFADGIWGLAAITACILLQGERFRRVAGLAVRLRFGTALAITWIGLFFSQFLPSSLGGEPFRIWYLGRHGLNLRRSTYVMLSDRVSGFAAIILVLLAGLPWLFSRVEEWPPRAVVLLIVGAGGLAIAAVLNLDRLLPLLKPAWRDFKAIAMLADAARYARLANASLSPGLPALALSIGAQILQAVMVWFFSLGLGLDTEFLSLLFFMPLANIATLLPVSIAGWGLREAVLVSAFHLLGTSSDEALAISVMAGFGTLAAAMPGLLLWLVIRQPAAGHAAAGPPEEP